MNKPPFAFPPLFQEVAVQPRHCKHLIFQFCHSFTLKPRYTQIRAKTSWEHQWGRDRRADLCLTVWTWRLSLTQMMWQHLMCRGGQTGGAQRFPGSACGCGSLAAALSFVLRLLRWWNDLSLHLVWWEMKFKLHIIEKIWIFVLFYTQENWLKLNSGTISDTLTHLSRSAVKKPRGGAQSDSCGLFLICL